MSSLPCWLSSWERPGGLSYRLGYGFEEVGDGLLGAQALGEEGLVVDGLGDLFGGYARAGIDELMNLIFAGRSVLLKMTANGVG